MDTKKRMFQLDIFYFDSKRSGTEGYEQKNQEVSP